jgi:hypothetical protein
MDRYFRSTSDVYTAVCNQLDAAYGYPNAETKTARTLPPLDALPTDDHGRVYLSVSGDYCNYILPGEILPGLLASGDVEEVTAEQYVALLPEPDPQP